MRIIQKLTLATLVASAISCSTGAIAGYVSLIPEGVRLETVEENREKLLNNYINSENFYKDYVSLQNELKNKHEQGLITTAEMIKRLNEFSSEETVNLSLLSSNSAIAQAYKNAVQECESVRKRIMIKSLIGGGCAVPAMLSLAALEIKHDKKSKENPKTNKTIEEYTK